MPQSAAARMLANKKLAKRVMSDRRPDIGTIKVREKAHEIRMRNKKKGKNC